MSTSRRYPKEVRERAVRLVFEREQDYPSQWSAISSIAGKTGMTPETLRKWVRQRLRDLEFGRRDDEGADARSARTASICRPADPLGGLPPSRLCSLERLRRSEDDVGPGIRGELDNLNHVFRMSR
jgi:transposase-like protein